MEVRVNREKLFEGVYRDVNIALANELSGACEVGYGAFAETWRVPAPTKPNRNKIATMKNVAMIMKKVNDSAQDEISDMCEKQTAKFSFKKRKFLRALILL